ncbi:MAG: tetratricopeptide repeat protein [Bacteroidetes bacterium]|nr:tetratricopeptide repeat protein [Bacteroidota bacterium]
MTLKSILILCICSVPFCTFTQVDVLLQRAEILINKQKSNEAEKILVDVLKFAGSKEPKVKVKVYFLYVKLAQYNTQSERALKYCYLSTREANKTKDVNLIFKSLLVFTEYYRWMDDLKLANVKLKEAEQLLATNNISLENQGYYFNRKAAIKSAMRQVGDTVILYSNKALDIYNQLKDSFKIASTINEIGYAYHSMKKYDESLKYYFKALAIYKKLNLSREMADLHVNMCRSFFDLKEGQKVVEFAQKGIDFTDKSDPAWHETLFYLYEHLALGYKLLGNFRRAYEIEKITTKYHLLYYKLKYDIATQNLEATHEVEKSKIELDQSKSDKKTFSILAILGVALSVLLGLLIVQLTGNLKKSKVLIVEKDFLVKEVHHRVKNNLQSLSSLINLHIGYVEDKAQISLITTIVRRVEAIGIIHGMLYQSEHVEFVNSKNFLMKFVEIISDLNSLELEKRFEKELDIDEVLLTFDECISLGSIVSELITNTTKYARTSEAIKITIGLKNMKEFIHFTYTDNGALHPAEESTFQPKKSLGLKLISLFTKKIGGFSIDLSPTFGYKFNFISNYRR